MITSPRFLSIFNTKCAAIANSHVVRNDSENRGISYIKRYKLYLVVGGGFEPPKAEPADLQSAPFDRSGTPPKIKPRILLERSTTVNRNTLIRRIFFCTATQDAAVVFHASALKKNYQKKPRNKNAHSAICYYWGCGHIFGAGDRS